MKVGIVTHYYNSTNYGGCLQAYALCKVLEDMGYTAHQLQIDYTLGCCDLLDPSPLAPVKRLVGKPLKNALKKTLSPGQRRLMKEKELRHQALLKPFARFTNETPHSEAVYTQKTIHRAGKEYDAFITGSDQVFNPMWYFTPFFLDFVPTGKPKVSYAASVAQQTLPAAVEKRYRKHLKDFTALSVREKSAVSLLEKLAPVKVEAVLDPTLLPERTLWEGIAAQRQIGEPYVFCYFLGDDPDVRKTAAAYAKSHGLKLATIPHAAGLPHVHDESFGDLALDTPSPEEFLSLIRHAEFVFTDSFHASVFSLIFQRQFVAVPRGKHKAMGTRLADLTALFDLSERFCDATVSLAQVEALPSIRYDVPRPKFQAERERSLQFLRDSLT